MLRLMAALTLLAALPGPFRFKYPPLAGEAARPPNSATSGAATSVSYTTTTLNGTSDVGKLTGTGYFRYSTTNPVTCDDVFGTRAPSSGGDALTAGSAAATFNEDLTGLTAGTVYYACAIVSNTAGKAFGSVVTFTTLFDVAFLPDSPAATECDGATTYTASQNGGDTTLSLTFSRGSTAYCTKGDGTIVSLANDKPRVRRVGGKNKIILEKAGQNEMLRSEVLGTGWTNGGGITVTTNTNVAPDGNTTMDKLAATGNGQAHYQQRTVTSTTLACMSAWMRSDTASAKTNTVGFFGASANVSACTCTREDGGSTSRVTSLSNECACKASVSTTPTRVIACGTLASAQTSIFGYLIPGDVDTAGAQAGVFWGAQLEGGVRGASSYIPTTTSVATRSADVLTISGTYKTGVAPSFAFDYTPYYPSGSSLIMKVGTAGDEPNWEIADDGPGTATSEFYYYQSSPLQSKATTSIAGLTTRTASRLAAWYDGAVLHYKVDATEGTLSNVFTPGTLSMSTIQFGLSGAGEFGGFCLSNLNSACR